MISIIIIPILHMWRLRLRGAKLLNFSWSGQNFKQLLLYSRVHLCLQGKRSVLWNLPALITWWASHWGTVSAAPSERLPRLPSLTIICRHRVLGAVGRCPTQRTGNHMYDLPQLQACDVRACLSHFIFLPKMWKGGWELSQRPLKR